MGILLYCCYHASVFYAEPCLLGYHCLHTYHLYYYCCKPSMTLCGWRSLAVRHCSGRRVQCSMLRVLPALMKNMALFFCTSASTSSRRAWNACFAFPVGGTQAGASRSSSAQAMGWCGSTETGTRRRAGRWTALLEEELLGACLAIALRWRD